MKLYQQRIRDLQKEIDKKKKLQDSAVTSTLIRASVLTAVDAQQYGFTDKSLVDSLEESSQSTLYTMAVITKVIEEEKKRKPIATNLEYKTSFNNLKHSEKIKNESRT